MNRFLIFIHIEITTAVRWGTRFLHNLPNPKLEAEILCANVLKKERSWLKTHSKESFPFLQIPSFCFWCWQRKRNIPMAQIIGYKFWAGLTLSVDKNVLIPRDETEILCEKIKAEKRDFVPQNVLDVGTGSGAIALFCAKHFPHTKVIALDLSPSALKVAQKNATLNEIHINFLHSDLLEKIIPKSHFDLIVANLPYLPEGLEVMPEVRKEPLEALFSGKDGLMHLRKLAKQLQQKNISFQELWLEFLPMQKEGIETIFSDFKVDFCKEVGGEIFFAKITHI